ncbi:hypothetical protein QTP70_006030 [Hemibagrus guttatus]|uniref:ribonuclease H n=1 Tax=Hemibagrus guttatus TaxID=175788 RepID=A0AAE0UXZ0_9TELE|nr:hypothetical protein QTP70_006030 [Hemibagrus guttatus]
MDRISRRSQELEGVRFGDHRISSLIFADDVVLLAPSSLDLQHALGHFAAECEAAGMRVSTSRSEAMVLNRKKVACTLQVGGELLPQVEEFKYLGVLFTSEGRMDCEIDRRIGAAAAVMRSMYRSVVVKKELSRKAKLSIYQSIYVPTLTYGHELWVMTDWAFEGENVTLPCYGDTRQDVKDVKWMKDGHTVLLYTPANRSVTTESRFKMSVESFLDGDLSLHISPVHPSDAGLYQCLIHDESQDGEPGAVLLKVEELGTVTLTHHCDVRNYNWLINVHDGASALYIGNRTKTNAYPGTSSIVEVNIGTDQFCLKASYEFTSFVEHPVYLLMQQCQAFLFRDSMVNKPLTLPCSCSGNCPEVRWIRFIPKRAVVAQSGMCPKHEHLQSRYSVKGDTSRGDFSLTISSVAYNDAGSYMCSCNGQTVTEVKLKVIVPTFVKAFEGENVTLPCYGDTRQDVKDVKWMKDGHTVLLYTPANRSVTTESRFKMALDKIRKDEVRKALKRMKSGKAVGPDDIPVEVWKCLGEAAVEFLASLFNRVLESERMPEEWRRSVLVPIFKNKGDVQSCSNYRGIKLMSHTMKLWERVVEARLRKVVEICEQQYGFMPRKSTTDAIFALRILMEKYRDGQRELHCVFVDLEKAYDRVPREELWYCMRKSGVAEKYVRLVQDMYERSRTVVRCAVGQTEEFKVEVGLHQGSALSPFLFAMVMDQLSEEVRQESPWTMMFADDIVICSESREQVEENLERWRFALERRGMKVSRSKTEYMCVNEREGSGTVRLQGEEGQS